MKELKTFYKKLFHFRVGLDSVFIWNDSEVGKKENERLEQVKQELNEIFK
jgi:hypothetical protein